MRFLCGIASLILVFSSEALPEERKGTVWIFTAVDCPIANGYAPELNRLREEFAVQGIQFYLVYPEPTLSESEIETHLSDYSLKFDFHHDKNHERVSASGASVTPEAVVYDSNRTIVYRGLIDNRYSEYGDRRNSATETYLRDVLGKLIAGERVKFSETKPIGCFIETQPEN